MKIADITDDSKTVSAHFGRVQFYDVFTITDNQIAARETRSKANHNHFPREHHEHPHGQAHGTDPASQHRHSALVEPIQVCQVLIAREMGMDAHQSLRDCFLTHHKGHKGLTFDRKNSCKSVKFVAENGLKDISTKFHILKKHSLITNGIHPIITNMDVIEDSLNSYLAVTLTDHPKKLH